MAELKTYEVHRSMHGDGRDYDRGDTREMTEADAEPLLASGALAFPGVETLARKPAVEHRYGAAPSDVNDRGCTTATGAGIAAGIAPVDQTAVRKLVAKPLKA